MSILTKKQMRIRRHYRVRNKLSGTAARPRMAVYRSNKRFEVQFIDDDARLTIAGVSSSEKNQAAARALGVKAAEAARQKNRWFLIRVDLLSAEHESVVHSAREAGLKF